MFAFTKLMQAMSGALPFNAEYLVLAGGGGGSGGGGGAGGLLEGTITSPTGSYTVTIGGGGAFGRQTTGNATAGSNSVLTGYTAIGGGYGAGGGGSLVAGGNGGSGGGASASTTGSASGGTATSGQGNAGGSATYPAIGWASGSGGGAGGAGVAGTWNTGNVSPFGPAGGAGKSSSITGTPTTYGAGGQAYWSDTVSADAPANLGGGGGGSRSRDVASDGWVGGSGVVIIAYPDSYPALSSIGGGLTYDQPTRAGYRVYRFTAGTGTITF